MIEGVSLWFLTSLVLLKFTMTSEAVARPSLSKSMAEQLKKALHRFRSIFQGMR